MNDEPYRVVILGAGIIGSSLGLILARQGIRTLIIDKNAHPRFALGESVLKPTVLWLRLLAERFDAQALGVIANLNKINDRMGSTCGVKRGFGFVRHEAGNDKTVAHWWSNIPVSYDEDVIETHLYRQDIDAYLHQEAIREGCTIRTGVDVNDVEIRQGHGVRLNTSAGEVSGDYLVDCTSFMSPLARLLHLREEPTSLKTNSRAIFTHMLGVRRFDDCDAAPAPALDWHEGTLHHILDGAWVWVIPFDNHPRSTNPLVSVGVNFDNEREPRTGLAAEQEWDRLLRRYPSLEIQFRHAKPVRPWVSTGRLQYSSATMIGDRFCLLGQAAGSVDALYSRGLLNNFQCMHLLAELLLTAVGTDDFSAERFLPLQRLQDSVLRVHDALVHGSYIGFASKRLTTWWLAIWSFTEQLSLSQLQGPFKALHNSDPALWLDTMEQLKQGQSVPHQEPLLRTLEEANRVMEAFKRQRITDDEAEAQLLSLTDALRPLGFDLEGVSRVLTQYGFSRSARTLLQVEQSLTMAVDIVDRQAGLPRCLRTSLLCYGLIRIVAGRAVRSREYTLHREALSSAFAKVMASRQQTPTDGASGMALIRCLSSLSFSRAESATARPGHPRAEPPRDWTTVLECHANGRFVGLHYRAAAGEISAFRLITEGNSERLTLILEGNLPEASLLSV